MAMMNAKRIFVDTNVLLACVDVSRTVHQPSLDFMEKGVVGDYRLFTCGQVLREFLVVVTRPLAENGMGLSPRDAYKNVSAFRKVIQVLDESAETAQVLAELVKVHGLKGKRIHDANLVAVMQSYGLRHLKTWNPKDFRAFSGVELV